MNVPPRYLGFGVLMILTILFLVLKAQHSGLNLDLHGSDTTRFNGIVTGISASGHGYFFTVSDHADNYFVQKGYGTDHAFYRLLHVGDSVRREPMADTIFIIHRHVATGYLLPPIAKH